MTSERDKKLVEAMKEAAAALLRRERIWYTNGEAEGLVRSLDLDAIIASVPEEKVRERFVIEKKRALPEWEELMSYLNYDSAMAALPFFRKDTKRSLRIMHRVEKCVQLSEGTNK